MNKNLTTHKDSLRYIVIALCLTLLLMTIQGVASYYANSLALFADSSHMLVHNSSLIVALVSSIISFRVSKKNLHKARIIDLAGGFINCLIFISIAIFIFTKGLDRIHNHHEAEINPVIMGVVSIIGFFIHSISAYILNKGKQYSFNVQALFLHTFIDCISTIFTFSASLLILFTDFKHADAFASLSIAMLVSYAGLKLLFKCTRKALHLKQEAILSKKISSHLKKSITKIANIHNIEVEINGDDIRYSAHIVLNKTCNKEDYTQSCIEKITNLLKKDFNINDSIIQLECD